MNIDPNYCNLILLRLKVESASVWAFKAQNEPTAKQRSTREIFVIIGQISIDMLSSVVSDELCSRRSEQF